MRHTKQKQNNKDKTKPAAWPCGLYLRPSGLPPLVSLGSCSLWRTQLLAGCSSSSFLLSPVPPCPHQHPSPGYFPLPAPGGEPGSLRKSPRSAEPRCAGGTEALPLPQERGGPSFLQGSRTLGWTAPLWHIEAKVTKQKQEDPTTSHLMGQDLWGLLWLGRGSLRTHRSPGTPLWSPSLTHASYMGPLLCLHQACPDLRAFAPAGLCLDALLPDDHLASSLSVRPVAVPFSL